MSPQSSDTALLNAILECAVDAIVIANKHGKISRINPAAAKMFGYNETELLGKKVNLLMPESMAERHDKFMSDHMKSGVNRIIGLGRDVEGQRKDGSIFPLQLSVGRADIGDEVIFMGIMHDLTGRKKTEEALSQSMRLDAIGQMTGGIAHDFNNLLTVMMGNLELLEMKEPDPKSRPLIADALEAAEMGADLTSRLMVFARKSSLSPELVDMNESCSNSIRILERTLGARYAMRTKFADDLPPVFVDPTQLQSSIINLSINAKDAMPKGGKLILETAEITIDDSFISGDTHLLPGKYVRLSISDTGTGMPPDALTRAFEPFFTTKPKGKGTGLGLSMVYGFVGQSGGHTTLYSELGHGTTISMYFPAVDSAGKAMEVNANVGELPQGAGQKILVVEDDPKVRRLSVIRLQDLGYQTLEAADADEARDLLADGTPVDLVFSDIIMPGKLTGYDLAKHVLQSYPEVKLLLTTGYADDVLDTPDGEKPKFSILRKPYRQADLAARLQAVFSEP